MQFKRVDSMINFTIRTLRTVYVDVSEFDEEFNPEPMDLDAGIDKDYALREYPDLKEINVDWSEVDQVFIRDC